MEGFALMELTIIVAICLESKFKWSWVVDKHVWGASIFLIFHVSQILLKEL